MATVLNDPRSVPNTTNCNIIWLEFLVTESEISRTDVILSSDRAIPPSEENETAILEEIKRLTPSHIDLLKLAEQNPPPKSWYDEEF